MNVHGNGPFVSSDWPLQRDDTRHWSDSQRAVHSIFEACSFLQFNHFFVPLSLKFVWIEKQQCPEGHYSVYWAHSEMEFWITAVIPFEKIASHMTNSSLQAATIPRNLVPLVPLWRSRKFYFYGEILSFHSLLYLAANCFPLFRSLSDVYHSADTLYASQIIGFLFFVFSGNGRVISAEVNYSWFLWKLGFVQ